MRERRESRDRREKRENKYRREHREEIYYISEIDKQAKNGKKIYKRKLHIVRKKREVEIVTAIHIVINESKATTDSEKIMEMQTY